MSRVLPMQEASGALLADSCTSSSGLSIRDSHPACFTSDTRIKNDFHLE